MPRAKSTSSQAKKTDTKTTKAKAAEEVKKEEKVSLIERVKRHKIALLVLLILAALAFLAYTYRSLIVAATVNGEPIYRYTLLTTAEQVAGPQVLEQLVTQKVIEQEAKERGLEVNQEDIDNAFNDLKAQYEEQGVRIETLMEQNNVTREQIEENLRPQVLQEKLIENEGIVVTDEEIDKFFEENDDLLPENPAELETTRENVRQSLKSQKVQQFLQRLRSEASVNYFVGN